MSNSIDQYELENFKSTVQKWLSIDDDIKKLKNAIKNLNKQKEQLNEPILAFMQNNEIDNCNTYNGKLKTHVTTHKKPINKKFLGEALATFLKNSKMGESASDYVFNNRETEQKVRLKRTVNRGGLDI